MLLSTVTIVKAQHHISGGFDLSMTTLHPPVDLISKDLSGNARTVEGHYPRQTPAASDMDGVRISVKDEELRGGGRCQR